MKIEDIEIGKWYYGGADPKLVLCVKVLGKSDTKVVVSLGNQDYFYRSADWFISAVPENSVPKKSGLFSRLFGGA